MKPVFLLYAQSHARCLTELHAAEPCAELHSREISQRTGLKSLHNGNVMARTFLSATTASHNEPWISNWVPKHASLGSCVSVIVPNNWHFSIQASRMLGYSGTKVMIASCLSTRLISQSWTNLFFFISGAMSSTHCRNRVTHLADRLKNTATSPTMTCAFRICGSLHAVDNVNLNNDCCSGRTMLMQLEVAYGLQLVHR